jgi:hypothetical protein
MSKSTRDAMVEAVRMAMHRDIDPDTFVMAVEAHVDAMIAERAGVGDQPSNLGSSVGSPYVCICAVDYHSHPTIGAMTFSARCPIHHKLAGRRLTFGHHSHGSMAECVPPCPMATPGPIVNGVMVNGVNFADSSNELEAANKAANKHVQALARERWQLRRVEENDRRAIGFVIQCLSTHEKNKDHACCVERLKRRLTDPDRVVSDTYDPSNCLAL